jgi:hypothetical protein
MRVHNTFFLPFSIQVLKGGGQYEKGENVEEKGGQRKDKETTEVERVK